MYNSSKCFKYCLLRLLKAPNELKHVLGLLYHICLEWTIALSQSICDVLILYHEILETSHLLVLSLEIAFEELWDLTQLLFLSWGCLWYLFTCRCDIFRDFLQTINESLLICLIAFNYLLSLSHYSIHIPNEKRMYLFLLFDDPEEFDDLALEGSKHVFFALSVSNGKVLVLFSKLPIRGA